MDILRYARSLRRHWRLLLVMTLVGMGAGVASAAAQPAPTTSRWFRAEHTLLCDAASPNLAQYAAFATTGPVPEQAAERLDTTPAQLTAVVRARPVPEAGFLQIIAVATDAGRAEEVADTVAEELTAYELELPDPQLAQEVARIDAAIAANRDLWNTALENGANAATLEEAEFYKQQHDEAIQQTEALQEEKRQLEEGGNRTACLSTVSSAEAVPSNRDSVEELLTAPQAGKNAANAGAGIPELQQSGNRLGPVPRGAAGAAGGLLAGIAIGLIIDRLDPRIRTKEQAEAAFGWPVIAEIPPLDRKHRKGDTIATHDQPRSRVAEAYRVLRSAILFAADLPDTARGSGAKANGTSNGNGNGSSHGGAAAGDEATASPKRPGAAIPGQDTDEQDAERSGRSFVTAGRRSGGRSSGGGPVDAGAPDQDERDEDDEDDETDERHRLVAALQEAVARQPELSGGATAEPSVEHDAIVVMVTSPGPSEGKTTSVANLAAAFAESDAKVLVVNCDFRRPRVHAFLGGDEAEAAKTPVASNYDNIDLFDHHSAELTESPAEILAEQRRMIRRSRTRYDVILLDTAPLLSTNDATEVLAESDLVVLVGRAGKTTKEAADRAAELLDRREAPVLGIALAGVTEGPGGRYYYYGANRYYSDETRRPEDPGRSPLEEMARTDRSGR